MNGNGYTVERTVAVSQGYPRLAAQPLLLPVKVVARSSLQQDIRQFRGREAGSIPISMTEGGL